MNRSSRSITNFIRLNILSSILIAIGAVLIIAAMYYISTHLIDTVIYSFGVPAIVLGLIIVVFGAYSAHRGIKGDVESGE